MKKLLFALCIVLLLAGCALNNKPPSYMKQVSAYLEGSDGFVVYFILADSSGKMTTASGYVTISIIETAADGSEKELYGKTTNATIGQFQKTKIGQGSFEREVILYSFGRYTMSDLTYKPEEPFAKVKVAFSNKGTRMEGEDFIFWKL